MSTFGHETTGVDVVKKFADRVKDKTFVITGTSIGGTGAESAIALAHGAPAHLFLLARSENKVTPVIEQVHAISPQTQTHYIPLALSDWSSVRRAAAEIIKTVPQVDAIINSAGGLNHEYSVNAEGVETTFASNHLGHFELTSLLMYRQPGVKSDMTVVNVASNGHGICPFRGDDYNFQDGKDYHRWAAYGQAKTAQMLFAVELAARGTRTFSLHPGLIMGTGATAGMDPSEGEACNEAARKYAGNVYQLSKPKSVQQGCATGLVAALDPDMAIHSGKYLEDCQVGEPYAYAASPEKAKELWALSEKLVGHPFERPNAENGV